MVAACIYVEGGARGPDSKVLTIACQKAFHQLLDSRGFKGRKPKPVACGSRGAVHERSVKAHANGTSDYVVEDAWLHLAKVTTVPQWKQPDGADKMSRSSMLHATRDCKNAYAQGTQSYLLLEKLDPDCLK